MLAKIFNRRILWVVGNDVLGTIININYIKKITVCPPSP